MPINLPLALTIGRVAAIPGMMLLFYVDIAHARQWSCVLFTLAAVTDWLDGYLARRWNQTTAFGAFLDPVADKLLVAVVLVLLLRDDVQHEAHRGMALLTAIIIGREITISALREWLAEMGQRAKVAVSWVGKVKTTFQMIAIGLMLWRDPFYGLPCYKLGYWCLMLAAVLTMWSMMSYLRAAWPTLRRGAEPA